MTAWMVVFVRFAQILIACQLPNHATSAPLAEVESKSKAWQVTALNFGKAGAEQSVTYAGLTDDAKVLWSNLHGAIEEDVVFDNDSLTVNLQPLEAKLIVTYAVSPVD